MTRPVLVDSQAPLGIDRTTTTRGIRRRLRGTPTPPGSGSDSGWLGRARDSLTMGDYAGAAYASCQVTDRERDNAEAWTLLATAYAGLGRYDDAALSAQRAVGLAPRVPEPHLTLAGILEDLGNWGGAAQCYRDVLALDPTTQTAQIGLASVLLHTGDTAGAKQVLDGVSAISEQAADQLALALLEAAERVAEIRDADTYFVTRPEEIASMRALLTRAGQVAHDSELRTAISDVSEYLDECGRRVFVPQRMVSGGPARVAQFVAVALTTIVVASLVNSGLSPSVVIAVAALALVLLALVLHARVPRWRINSLSIVPVPEPR